MNFTQYINGLPNMKMEEIKKIAELTRSSIQAVYRWINGANVPPVKRKIIADYLGKSEEELWPELAEAGKGGAE